MQYVLGLVLEDGTEIIDNMTSHQEAYSFLGLSGAIRAGKKKLGSSEFKAVNIYKVLAGQRLSSPKGQFQLVHYLLK